MGPRLSVFISTMHRAEIALIDIPAGSIKGGLICCFRHNSFISGVGWWSINFNDVEVCDLLFCYFRDHSYSLLSFYLQ